MPIKVIAFDADDTLWLNEPFFREAEEKFASLLEDFMPEHAIIKELYRTEIENLQLYGYGIKGFMLSMIETAMKISEHKMPILLIEKVIKIGREMLEKPVELLPGVEEVLKSLNGDYRIVLATKGDLLDQERKLKKSGLEKYFHHIEIMSEKKVADFEKLIRHLDVSPSDFVMLGNSLKSDILPVLEIGGHAIHIPFHITWIHEQIDHEIQHERFAEVENISLAADLIRRM
ncbi:MAG TPA: HAD family hydrolase [Algoriphagus sp.]|jgi:putative hydrolase of the HAD superfamily|uniref:HAD family hydrolase n=2 Tax=Algoriphagus TaxID=246875 RepID=UPI000C4B8DB1|nr:MULTISPECIES: HAD family hydrolase [unclassified Algoriphagus]MAL15197.1 HAD family hydrolase [Algoriphagus sp.]MAN85443.1 HAD family hydrolase [Algoriphagus sp.]QYH37825.1 HAD family hydrolase [Algoriphagus sp. NBT04N3]HAH36216.1 HAD family hydrolase [Algoriphagus sp.]HAS60202.1 HAD family hydrolase [Algoriphagus sp.]|tara:strand:+ start:4340 stop:5032 length:693 start_codon:yes stop_codon:yes gene_type:complete